MTYDITDKKRLKRAAKILLRYGQRVQKSVFACDINERRRRELESKLRAEKADGDSIMIIEYRAESAEELAGGGARSPEDAVRPAPGKKRRSDKKTGKKRKTSLEI